MTRNKLLALVPVFLVSLTAIHEASAQYPQQTPQCDFRSAMRKLWEDHITWTRVYIISAVANLPDKTAATNRLLKNQVDIGDAIKPYYGDAAGQKLTTLLKAHILIGGQLIDAVRMNDAARIADGQKRWYANADEIACFLSSLNPTNWPLPQMRQMMFEHLAATTAEVQARVRGDWRADVAAYDRVHEQILHMADMLSTGIINQFPEKFTSLRASRGRGLFSGR